MINWNTRNGQRATVKRPGTKQYHNDFHNKENQFYNKRRTRGCSNCGNVEVIAQGGNGRIFVYCSSCGKQLRVINTKPTKVGNWSEMVKYRTKAGLCTSCGNGNYYGKSHVDCDGKYSLQLVCRCCGHKGVWHNL